MTTFYRAKLKTRKQMERDIPRQSWGWWIDVCPGQTLVLRDATEADLARCIVNEGQSGDPKDYLCETFERGALVAHVAVAELTQISEQEASRMRGFR